jgi:hypothetical protein
MCMYVYVYIYIYICIVCLILFIWMFVCLFVRLFVCPLHVPVGMGDAGLYSVPHNCARRAPSGLLSQHLLPLDFSV